MKRTKTHLILAFCCITAILQTSCTEESKEKYIYTPLTQEQKTAQINAIAGNYEGYAYYDRREGKFTDSTEVKWVVTASDSLMVMEKFPLKALRSLISDAKLKEAISKDSVKRMNANIYLYKPYGAAEERLNSTYFYHVVPFGSKEFVMDFYLIYGDVYRNATLTFISHSINNNLLSGGFYTASQMSFELIPKSLKVTDEKGDVIIDSPMSMEVPLRFTAVKTSK